MTQKITINNLRNIIKILNDTKDYASFPAVNLNITGRKEYFISFARADMTHETPTMACKECYSYLRGLLTARADSVEMLEKYQSALGNQKVIMNDQANYALRLEKENGALKEKIDGLQIILQNSYDDDHGEYIEFLENLVGKMRGFLPFNTMFMDYQRLDATINLAVAKQAHESAKAALDHATKEIERLEKEEDDNRKEFFRE